MIKEAILKLSKKENLNYEEAKEVMNEIMSGKATAVQMSSYNFFIILNPSLVITDSG